MSIVPRCSRSLTALGVLCAFASLHAQTPAAKPAGADDTVRLSPFEVSATANKGYGASETMTGSRVRTQIIDLPYSVNVMTSEFLSDFGIFELSDNVSHIGGFTGLDVGGNFMLRGFASSNQLRDGFFRLGRYGSSNIDRIEVIKGSSAAIYGRTSPGGMMNMISKAPKDQAAQELKFNYGGYNTQRVTLEATGPLFPDLLGNTRYVLTGSTYQRDFQSEFARIRNEEYYFAGDHVFKDGSKLTLTGEFFFQQRSSPEASAPLVIDAKGTASTADDTVVGYALNLGKVNAYGPNSELNRGSSGFNAIYEKQLSPIFSARVSTNIYTARRWDFNQNTGWGAITINPAVAAAPTSQRGATPARGRIYEDGGAFQGDILAHYFTNDHKIEHRTLVTLDINDYFRYDPTLSFGGSTNPDIVAWNLVRKVTLDNDFNPVGPVAYFPKTAKESPGEVLTRDTRRRTTLIGGLLRQQTSLFDGRLLAFAGVRFDQIHYRHKDKFTAASSFTPFIPDYVVGQTIDRKLTAAKPNFGVNYKIKENFRVFANYSESYFVNQGDTPLDIANPAYKAETADGWDYGFKGSLLNDRLTYTLCGFYINRYNVSVTDTVETPLGSGNFVQVSRRDGDQLVRGFEADVNWLMTDEVSLLASYGSVNSIVTDFGTSFPEAVGRKVQFVAPYNGSVSVKYSPSHGIWKNFSANLGVTFVGATPTELPNAGDTLTTTPVTGVRVVTAATGQFALKAPAYNIWSFGMRYTLKTKNNLSHTIGLNVNNLFDADYFKAGTSGATTRLLGDRRALFVTYTIGHKGTKF